MEKFLLNNMTKILFSFACIIFFTWLIQYLNLTFLNPIQIPFIKEHNFEDIISTFQMLTTIGAIFAFWYWYMKYERDKEVETINNLTFKMGEMDKLIYGWHIQKVLHDKRYVKDYLWKEVERYYMSKIDIEIMMSDWWQNMEFVELNEKILVIRKLMNHNSSQTYFRSKLRDFIPKIEKKFDFIDKFENTSKESWAGYRWYFENILNEIKKV